MNQNLFIKKVEKTFKILINDLFFFGFFFNQLSQFKNKPFFCFWSIINMWFHIIGSYTSEKINHSNGIDCPKYLNKNQALFRHKTHMTAELCLVHILGIQANWEIWRKKKPQTTWDTQNIFLSLQLHIQHLIRSSGYFSFNHFMQSIGFSDPFFNLGMHIN